MSKIEFFETDGAARTLLIPLWCRAEFARRYPASGLACVERGAAPEDFLRGYDMRAMRTLRLANI